MTYPRTDKSDATLGGPPEYPTSQMMPPEYWRKQPDGDLDHDQYQTIEIRPGVYEKRPVEPGWVKPVAFETKEYLKPRDEEE